MAKARRRRSPPAKAPALDPRARIYAVVRKVPRGSVVTYGQVAELAGIPGAARFVGAAMRACPPGKRIPWHRVLARRSRTTAQIGIEDRIGAGTQRALLESEGVRFTASGGVALREHGWLPLDA